MKQKINNKSRIKAVNKYYENPNLCRQCGKIISVANHHWEFDNKVTKEYYQTEDEKVYFFEPLEKEISVEDMQKIVDANKKLVKDLKDDEWAKPI